MNILLYCKFFYPSIGGTEKITETLAKEFVAAGHPTRILTRTPYAGPYDFPVPVIRRASLRETFGHLAWSDVVFQNHVGPRAALPALAVGKPLVVLMQNYVHNKVGGWRSRAWTVLFQGILRRARVLSVSEFVRRANGVGGGILHNPYEAGTFRRYADVARTRDLLFVGRFVDDKGVDVLLRAFARLRTEPGRKTPRLTLVGTGPEEPALRGLAGELGCADAVDWAGTLRGEALARCMNAHQVLVVPSRWNDPCPVVGIEGVACGCVVVGSGGGGLSEVIGPCGLTFPNGDDAALANRLREVLDDPVRCEAMRADAPAHLQQFQPARVAAACLQEMGVAVRAKREG